MGTAAQLTISVHTHDEVVTHGPGLAQLVGVAIMYHVVAVESTGLSFPCWGSALFLCSVIRKPAKKPPRELPPGSQLGFQREGCSVLLITSPWAQGQTEQAWLCPGTGLGTLRAGEDTEQNLLPTPGTVLCP